MAEHRAKRVLIVGWSGDWNLGRPLLAQGLMPNLQRLLKEGAHGELSSVTPLLSPPAWTSIATGKRPFKHGIHGLFEADEDIGGARPATSERRVSKAIWNMLTEAGYKAHVIGWPASHPAEAITGVNVTDQHMTARVEFGKPWPQPERSVHPVELRSTMAGLRVHPEELDCDTFKFFVPALDSATFSELGRLKPCTRWLAASVTNHAIATWAMEHRPWDFMALCYAGMERLLDAYLQFMPPRQEFVSSRDFELFHNIVPACFQLHDMMLGRLLQLAGEDATVILISPYGWKSAVGQSPRSQQSPEDVESWRRPRGMIVVRDDRLQPGAVLEQVSVLDVTPTVLQLFGLPVGADMEGQPLPQLAAVPGAADPIASWDAVNRNADVPSAESDSARRRLQSMIEQLSALGYRDPQEEQLAAEQGRTIQRNRLNLARSLLEAGRIAQAIEVLEPLQKPTHASAAVSALLIEALLLTGAYDRAQAAVERLQVSGAGPRLIELSLGRLELGRGNPRTAIEHLLRANSLSPNDPRVWVFLGRAQLALSETADARCSFERAVTLDPEYPDARDALLRIDESGD